MKINFIDIDNLLELNPDMKVSLKSVGKEQIPILIIDDFYLNPEPIRELFFKVPVPRMPPELNVPYERARIKIPGFLTSDKFQKNLSNILRNFFDIDYDIHNRNYEFLFNFFGGCLSEDCDTYFAPHSDPCEVACVIYFNTDKEDVGGTSIYRHKKSDLIFNPKIDFHKTWWKKHLKKIKAENPKSSALDFKQELYSYEDTMKHFKDQKRENWDVVATIESKYNRCVAYVGGVLHGPVVNVNDLKNRDYNRINQVLFMQK